MNEEIRTQEIRYCSRQQRRPCPAGLTTGRRARVYQSFRTLAHWVVKTHHDGGRFCLFSILILHGRREQFLPTTSRTQQLRHAVDNPNHGGQVPSLLSPRPHRLERSPTPVFPPVRQEQRPFLAPEIPVSVRSGPHPRPTDEVKGHPTAHESSIQNPGDGRSKTERCIVPAPRWPCCRSHYNRHGADAE